MKTKLLDFAKSNVTLLASPIMFLAYWFLPKYAPNFLGWTFLVFSILLLFTDFLADAVVTYRKRRVEKGKNIEILGDSGKLEEIPEEKRQESLLKLKKTLPLSFLADMVGMLLWVVLLYRIAPVIGEAIIPVVAFYSAAVIFTLLAILFILIGIKTKRNKKIMRVAHWMHRAQGTSAKIGAAYLAINILF